LASPRDSKASQLARLSRQNAALKRELAARYPTDRDAYTDGKARYVDDIVRKAGTP